MEGTLSSKSSYMQYQLIQWTLSFSLLLFCKEIDALIVIFGGVKEMMNGNFIEGAGIPLVFQKKLVV